LRGASARPQQQGFFCDIFDNLNLGERIDLPQVSAAQELQIKAQTRLASLMEETPSGLRIRRLFAIVPTVSTIHSFRRLSTGRGRTDGDIVGCQGDHHAVTVRAAGGMPSQ
jgi:hypothetical protein